MDFPALPYLDAYHKAKKMSNTIVRLLVERRKQSYVREACFGSGVRGIAPARPLCDSKTLKGDDAKLPRRISPQPSHTFVRYQQCAPPSVNETIQWNHARTANRMKSP